MDLVNSLNISCEFSFTTLRSAPSFPVRRKRLENLDAKFYKCTALSLNITTENVEVTKILGNQISSYKSSDVKWLSFESCVINFIPIGIEDLFNNIQFLDISKVDLLKLTQNDMKQFPNIRFLWSIDNELTELELETFDYNHKLIYIDFSKNRIKYLNYLMTSRIISRNGLAYINVRFEDNDCIYLSDDTLRYGDFGEFEKCIREDEIFCHYYDFTDCVVEDTKEFLMIEKTKIIGNIDGDGHDDSNITKVSVTTSNYTKIPEIFGEKFWNLEHFEFHGKIKNLYPENLQKFKNLKKLNLAANQIGSLTSDTFVFNLKLEVIDLSSNRISTIGISTFAILRNLTTLILNNNQEIDENFSSKSEIEGSQNLRDTYDLDTINCGYSTSNFRYTGSLYFCHVINPTYFDYYTIKLQKFFGFTGRHAENKSHQNIEALIAKFTTSTALDPKVSYHFPNLRLIRITNSNLMYLHENNFDNLPNLQVLDLSDNKITEVPNGIFNDNQNLISIDFSKNKIVKIYEIFGRFENLEIMKFWDNFYFNFEISQKKYSKLVDLDSHFDSKIENIYEVEPKFSKFDEHFHENFIFDDKSNNSSTKVTNFYGQPSIFQKNIYKTFNFCGNPQIFNNLSSEIPNFYGVFINCEVIYPEPESYEATIFNTSCHDFNVQQITQPRELTNVTSKYDTKFITNMVLDAEVMYYLPIRIYKFFPNLVSLRAKGKIRKIFKQNFENLFQLEEIFLNDNQIEFIDNDQTFQDNPKLERIFLSQNKIKRISENVFKNLINLKTITLERNYCSLKSVSKNENLKNSKAEAATNICGAKLPENFGYY